MFEDFFVCKIKNNLRIMLLEEIKFKGKYLLVFILLSLRRI